MLRRLSFTALCVGAGAGAICLTVAVLAAGYGHGTYLPAIILFPWSMALSAMVGSIAIPLVILAVIQFPAYGALVGMAAGGPKRRAIGLLVAHMLAAGVAFALARADGSFLR